MDPANLRPDLKVSEVPGHFCLSMLWVGLNLVRPSGHASLELVSGLRASRSFTRIFWPLMVHTYLICSGASFCGAVILLLVTGSPKALKMTTHLDDEVVVLRPYYLY